MKKRDRSVARDHRISTRQWLEVLDELNIGAMIVDRRYRIQAINHCAQALIGMRLNEVAQCDCREVFTGVPCVGTCVVESGGRNGYADATVHFFEEEECAYTVTRIATPIFDDNHQVAGCLTILQDHSPISDLIDRLRYEEHRLNVVHMELPPLTERLDDLPLLIHHVLRKLSAARGLPPPMITKKAMQVLLNYAYPGNVREIENILEHVLILCRNDPIEDHHLPDYLHLSFRGNPRGNFTAKPVSNGKQQGKKIKK